MLVCLLLAVHVGGLDKQRRVLERRSRYLQASTGEKPRRGGM